MTVYQYLNYNWKVPHRLLREQGIPSNKNYADVTLGEYEMIASALEMTVQELLS